ncbi:hypothetical protein ALO_04878 [Acetonema longum DSM 6540]|uniref:Uncharacterized protein n=1 Tax=Acetonema longum DSM 6540 TaxID=1009370 RepID=F7NFZ2_9FIRM|nr:hypothetical protein ALO_04878 [Acetonema longum DSM 6540]
MKKAHLRCLEMQSVSLTIPWHLNLFERSRKLDEYRV